MLYRNLSARGYACVRRRSRAKTQSEESVVIVHILDTYEQQAVHVRNLLRLQK